MDIIDRIAELLRDLFGESDRPSSGDPSRAERPRRGNSTDPDLDEAWQELNDYLGPGQQDAGSSRTAGGAWSSGAGSAGGTRGRGTSSGSWKPGSGNRARSQAGSSSRRPLEALRQDYANLEVPFGSDMETVRRSYKKLMLRYHPDKHGGDPEKQRVALEITKRINESFERIRSFHEGGGR